MGEKSGNSKDDKNKVRRCMEWLQQQNNEGTEKLSLGNKNDIQFIIQTHAARKNFLLAVAEDDATVPSGINEPVLEPKPVTRYRLRVSNLQMECEWPTCKKTFTDYEVYQKHVRKHATDMHVIEKESSAELVCLWDVCGHKTSDFNEMVRHMNYHAYHGKLLAIGFNGRTTLKLECCKKDSSKRNQIPVQVSDYTCMWIKCDMKFTSIQTFIDHVNLHANYSEDYICSWAGCGAKFPRKAMLIPHVRSHTGERLIACYHCGHHFANNRKLTDHLRRQNVTQNSIYVCSVCGTRCATEYLLGEHTRGHISMFACSLCDMSATSPAALANHVRYRHLARGEAATHACPHCPYKAIRRWDLRQHVKTQHKKKKKKLRSKKIKSEETSDKEISSDIDGDSESDSDSKERKVRRSDRKYVCHMCPEKNMKIFTKGNALTMHLVKEHGAQWSFGHSRFRYQLCEDGLYRLTTTRYESLEVSKKIMDGYTSPKKIVLTNIQFKLRQVANATATTPRSFEITLKNDDIKKDNDHDDMEVDTKPIRDDNVEIMMCDVDEEGNIISSELINSVIPKLEKEV
ncbi:histone H4 transcription factor [Spodoptera litura]|uniref:Histone H4 transcription factor n=1 Tax=Spodoptera litura TaxID=69820 RepID=A0A9J7E942_SPOLT|nr:histone H4 transcription factor [Spodoptera litura]